MCVCVCVYVRVALCFAEFDQRYVRPLLTESMFGGNKMTSETRSRTRKRRHPSLDKPQPFMEGPRQRKLGEKVYKAGKKGGFKYRKSIPEKKDDDGRNYYT